MLFEGLLSRTADGRLLVKCAAYAAAVSVVAGAASIASAAAPPQPVPLNDQFFDWMVNDHSGFVSSPFLNDSNAGSVNAFLGKQPSGAIRAVKVVSPISNATAKLIFDNPKYHVSYVLGDLEGPTAVSDASKLVKQVEFVNGSNGAKTVSSNAFVGNFGFATFNGSDVTRPPDYSSDRGTHSFSGYTNADFHAGGLTMHMPELYAGSPSFKNPAAGNSTAPNIRSALFTLPVLRLSEVSVSKTNKEALVPYVARFNNWMNLALDSDRDASNGYNFVPGQAMPAKNGLPAVQASDTVNQMLSRRDFAAEIAHLRLRGADSVVAFEPGVVGYNNTQKRDDIQRGWTEPHINAIFAASDHQLVIGKDSDYPSPPVTGKSDPNGNIIEDHVNKSIEAAGALFSGVYSLSLQKLDILLSNMDDDTHELELPPSIGGFALSDDSFSLGGGSHLLVEYKLANKKWNVDSTLSPFGNIDGHRNGVGIPEPTATALVATMGVLCTIRRRHRRNGAGATESA